MQVREWMSEFDAIDGHSSSDWSQQRVGVQSSIDELSGRQQGPRVVGRRRCTVQYTHYVADLATLPVHGTLAPATCHDNCSR